MGYDVLVNLFIDMMRHVHTIKPAVVKSVDLEKNKLSARILTATKYQDGHIQNFTDVEDVPFFILAGDAGNARITIPPSVGDNVVILFSDRDYGSLLESDGQSTQNPSEIKTHEFYPLIALPDFFTSSTAKKIEADKIVIENGVTSIKIDSIGNIEITAPQTMTITTPSLMINCPATVFTGTIATAGILPAPGVGSVPMTGNYNMTGSFTLNGVVQETHSHYPSIAPPYNP